MRPDGDTRPRSSNTACWLVVRLTRELVNQLGDTDLAWDLADRAAAVERKLLALEEEVLV